MGNIYCEMSPERSQEISAESCTNIQSELPHSSLDIADCYHCLD